MVCRMKLMWSSIDIEEVRRPDESTGNRAINHRLTFDKHVLSVVSAVMRSCNYHSRVIRHTRPSSSHLDRSRTDTWLVVASSQASTTGSLPQCCLAQRSSQQHPEAGPSAFSDHCRIQARSVSAKVVRIYTGRLKMRKWKYRYTAKNAG